MALDAFNVGLGQQLFHLVFEVLPYQIVFDNRNDQDFPKLWHGLVRENPTVNNFRAGKQRKDRHQKECNQYEQNDSRSARVSSR